MHELLRVSRSPIVHLITPGGNCNEADPLNTLSSSRTRRRRSGALCSKVITFPFFATRAVPVKTVSPQQKRYSPVVEFP